MAREPQRIKRRERKNISAGVAHVNASFNNTMVTITEFAPHSLDGGVTTTTAAPTSPEGFVFPTAAELRKLEALVYRMRPGIDLRTDRDFRTMNHARAFTNAFRALSWMGRRDDVDPFTFVPDFDRTRRRLVIPVDRSEQRALAAARGPEQDDAFAALNPKLETVEYRQFNAALIV